ncbi:MAG: hypothetical protein Q9N34_09585 [Aquificota bacterium]|nr:hypothetical protein [Aquificota bacterium]
MGEERGGGEPLCGKGEENLWRRVKDLEDREDLSLEDLGSLKPLIDALFEKVLIMDRDRRIRENRLALLLRTKGVFNRIADFELVVL